MSFVEGCPLRGVPLYKVCSYQVYMELIVSESPFHAQRALENHVPMSIVYISVLSIRNFIPLAGSSVLPSKISMSILIIACLILEGRSKNPYDTRGSRTDNICSISSLFPCISSCAYSTYM